MSLFDLNRATLVGNITRDPELKYTAKGTALLKLGIATNRSMQKEDGSYQDMPTFHNIVAWSKLAERMAQILAKGQKIYVEGRIENRSFEVDGQKRFTSEVVADNIISFEKGKGGGKPAASSAPSKQPEPEPAMNADQAEDIDPNDIPF